MVDRETPLHGTIAVLAVLAYVVIVHRFEGMLMRPTGGVLAAGVLVVAFGGLTHALLAARGHSGDLSVRARWRYVLALVAVVAVPIVASSLFERGTAAGQILTGWLIVVVVGYVAVEIRAGYRESIDQ
ncbi:MAG: hypothetical protein ABEJ86_07985 [Halococcoides sp.]